MKLRKLSANSSVIETSRGAILFSYERPVALKLILAGDTTFKLWPGRMSTADRAHLQRFGLSSRTASTSKDEFTWRMDDILKAGLNELITEEP